MCPVTEQPDLSNVVIEYAPDQWCVESKSLKLYLWSFRDRAVFAEALAAEIAGEVMTTAKLKWVSRHLLRSKRGRHRSAGRRPPPRAVGRGVGGDLPVCSMPSQPVSVITNDDHRSHDPEYDVYSGTIVGRFEVPQRVDCIVRLDGGPTRPSTRTSHGMPPDLAGAQPGSRRLLVDGVEGLHHGASRCAGRDRRDVHPSRSRRGMPVGRPPVTNAYGRLGWFCFDTSSPLSEGSWPAALASVDIALSGVDRVLAGERIVYSLCRPPGHHATRSAFGGFCLLAEQCRDRRAGVDRCRGDA